MVCKFNVVERIFLLFFSAFIHVFIYYAYSAYNFSSEMIYDSTLKDVFIEYFVLSYSIDIASTFS